jgi:hypothetical protein
MHDQADHAPEQLDPHTLDFYHRAMDVLTGAGVPFLVGGAYSLAHFAGVVRHTKDFDVFLRRSDLDRALRAFENAGYRTQRTFPHWLAKAFKPTSDDFVDVIYGSGNGLCHVDDEWFAHAVDGIALDRPARLVPAEEIIWTKAFVQERERFDGADIAHLLLHRGPDLDWQRLLRRFAGHEQVLLAHLLLFTYIYPGRRGNVPPEVIDRLTDAVRSAPPAPTTLCRGPLLSRAQYLPDLRAGFHDARLAPRGPLTQEDVQHWTAAIGTIR